jgi:hypothetical protein
MTARVLGLLGVLAGCDQVFGLDRAAPDAAPTCVILGASDDFNGASLDGAKWAEFVNDGTTVGVVGQRLEINLKQPAGASSYSGVDGRLRFDLAGATVEVEVQAPADLAHYEASLQLIADDENRIGIGSREGQTTFYTKTAGVDSTTRTMGTHRFWRFVHVATTNAISLEYSDDRVEWGVGFIANPVVPIDRVRNYLYGGTWATGAAQADRASFDNVLVTTTRCP